MRRSTAPYGTWYSTRSAWEPSATCRPPSGVRTPPRPRPSSGGEPKRGVVHDENAESLGGVAGHAGLFGTAPDLAHYLRACWLSEESVLSRRMRTEALNLQTRGLNGARGLGWTLPGDDWDHMSPHWPSSGAGHTGFTGTSLALDPVSGIWVVLLTNAVHYGRGARAKTLRRVVHAAVARTESALSHGS